MCLRRMCTDFVGESAVFEAKIRHSKGSRMPAFCPFAIGIVGIPNTSEIEGF